MNQYHISWTATSLGLFGIFDFELRFLSMDFRKFTKNSLSSSLDSMKYLINQELKLSLAVYCFLG